MKKVFLIIMFLLVIPIKVSAICPYEEKVRLNNIAKNLDLTYDYYYVDNKVRFTITITNLHPDIYIYDKEHFLKLYYNTMYDNSKEISINGFLSGESYIFQIYGNTPNCMNELIMTQYKTVPAYNAYSTDPLCIGIEEFDLCQKWKSAPISYDEFVRLVTEYKDSKEVEEEKEKEEIKDFSYYIRLVLDHVSEYYIFYVAAMILMGILVYLLRQNDNFNID